MQTAKRTLQEKKKKSWDFPGSSAARLCSFLIKRNVTQLIGTNLSPKRTLSLSLSHSNFRFKISVSVSDSNFLIPSLLFWHTAPIYLANFLILPTLPSNLFRFSQKRHVTPGTGCKGSALGRLKSLSPVGFHLLHKKDAWNNAVTSLVTREKGSEFQEQWGVWEGDRGLTVSSGTKPVPLQFGLPSGTKEVVYVNSSVLF